jgi:hypothetical protein
MNKSDGKTHYIITCKDGETDLIYGNYLFHSAQAAKAKVGDWDVFQKTSCWRLQAIKFEFIKTQNKNLTIKEK